MITLREIINKRDTLKERFISFINNTELSKVVRISDTSQYDNIRQSVTDTVSNSLSNIIVSNDIIAEYNSKKEIKFEFNNNVYYISMVSALAVKHELETYLNTINRSRLLLMENIEDVNEHNDFIVREYTQYKKTNDIENINRVSAGNKKVETLTFDVYKEQQPQLNLAGIKTLSEIDDMKDVVEDSINSLNAEMLKFNVMNEIDFKLL